MPIAADFQSVYSEKHTVTFPQCLPSGYLKYTELLNMLQITAASHAEKGGISFTDMQAHDQAWVLSRMRVEISKMPRWRDEITIKTWIISLENSRSVRGLEVFFNDEKIIGCETFWAVFNTEKRRPETLGLPHSHFEKFGSTLSTSDRVSKITLPNEMQNVQTHQVVLSDLDIVNHVNNVKYLEWCLDCENPNDILESKVKSFDMNFMRELTYQDLVEILNQRSDNHSFYSLEKDEKSCFILKIEYK